MIVSIFARSQSHMKALSLMHKLEFKSTAFIVSPVGGNTPHLKCRYICVQRICPCEINDCKACDLYQFCIHCSKQHTSTQFIAIFRLFRFLRTFRSVCTCKRKQGRPLLNSSHNAISHVTHFHVVLQFLTPPITAQYRQ